MQFLPSVLAYQSSLPTVTAAPVVLAPHAPAAVTAAPVVLAPHAPATVFTTAPVVLASVAPTPDIPAAPVVLAPTAPATVVAAVPVVLAPPAPTLVISAAPASLVPIPPSPVVTPPSLPVSFAAVVAPPVLPNDTMVIDDDSDTDEDTATLIATVMTALRQARKRKPSPAPVPRVVVPPVAVAVPAPAPITSAPAVVTTTAPIVAEPVRVHGGPRVPSPTKYSGADNEIVEDFIFTFENYLTASGVPRAAWPSHVLHLLTGKALNAWLAVARPMQLLGEPVTWELLTHTLLQTFPHHDLALAARKRLHAIEQTGRVQDYLQLVRTLVSRAGSPATSDTDLLLMFWKGLKQSIKDQAKVDPRTGTWWSSFEDLAKHCVALDMSFVPAPRARVHHAAAKLPIKRPLPSLPAAIPNKLQHIQAAGRGGGRAGRHGAGRGGRGGGGGGRTQRSADQYFPSVKCNRCLNFGHYATQCAMRPPGPPQ